MLYTETAVGYLIATLEKLGYTDEKIDEAVQEMFAQLDSITGDQADEILEKWNS